MRKNSTNKKTGFIPSNFPAPKSDLQIPEWNDLIPGHGSWKRVEVSWTDPDDH